MGYVGEDNVSQNKVLYLLHRLSSLQDKKLQLQQISPCWAKLFMSNWWPYRNRQRRWINIWVLYRFWQFWQFQDRHISNNCDICRILYGQQAKYYEAEQVPVLKHTKPGLLSMVNVGDNMYAHQINTFYIHN